MLDLIKRLLLGAVDRINMAASPFAPFTRPLETIDERPLSEKAAIFRAEILKKFTRADGRLFAYMLPHGMGDQAIWHGFATAAFVFTEDHATAEKFFEGHVLLQQAGGKDRLCRGVDPIGGDADVDPSKTYYHANGFRFQQDCSESSLIGHLFGLWALYQSTNAFFRTKLPPIVEALAERITKDGLVLRNQDDSAARHGDLRPLTAPWQLGTRKPVATAAAAALLGLAAVSTGLNKYLVAYREFSAKNLIDISFPETHFLWAHPIYQDILAYMVLAMLIDIEIRIGARYEVLAAYRGSLKNMWKKTCENGNPFYAYICKFSGIDVSAEHLARAKQTLDEFNAGDGPNAKRLGPVRNTDESFVWGPKWLKGGNRYARQPIPAYRRPPADILWQRSPYGLDGEESHSFSGIDFLCAYGLGRACGALP